ncbi:MAG: deoxyribose-phosphate aldolase [Bacteroidota bacterium]|nr:deoxyribose-phosphate aldolase [Bacteroidota bacterium]
MDELKTILSCIDLTSLDGADNNSKIISFCREAKSFGEKGFPLPATVCVYPVFARIARQELSGSGIGVASVAGAFPSGQSPLKIRVDEVRFALEEGAQEIDMVISRGKFLEGNEQAVYDEIAAVRALPGEFLLKVILETGELKTPENIRRAAEIAIVAGADFIKTSTGKISQGATPEAVSVMLDVIRHHFHKTGKLIGIKPSGGISEPRQALSYYRQVEQIAGKEWLNKKYFRIGASRLANALVHEISSRS